MKKLKVYASKILKPIITVLIAFIIGGIIIAISGKNPFYAYAALFKGAFAGNGGFYNTLFSATPLIYTGIATAIAFRANIFNMGVEGQLYLGAFTAAYIGFFVTGLPPILHVTLCIVAAAVVAGIFAAIPGLLKGYLNVDEMVVTIMLNYVATLFTGYLASYPFKAKGIGFSATEIIQKSAEIPRFSKLSQLNVSFIIALLVVAFAYVLFKRTTLGLEIKSIGENRNFAEANGMNTSFKILIITIISGMIGGMAGAGEVLGVHHRFIANFSPGYGWDGMTIALLGKNNPVGVLIAALFFGVLKSGGSTMELVAGVPRSLISILQGLIIFFLAIDLALTHPRFKSIKRKGIKKQAAKEM
ncbi:ABC transporter permease [Clostridium rectalis]|uniref:ABC transporter permease n=1 Tax=Clostridium rectalis TaxID=2040295 RepID=UPI000F6429C0|nr:ABC transporter permease [Clostridium rectalis]